MGKSWLIQKIDHTASVNSKGGVRPLVWGPNHALPTSPYQTLHQDSWRSWIEGRHAVDYCTMNTEHGTGSLPGPARARKEARSKMMWLISCGWVQRSQEDCDQAGGQSRRLQLGFLPERPVGQTGHLRDWRLFFKKAVELLLGRPLVDISRAGTLGGKPSKQYWTWRAPVKS